jgi:hypothetical protein
MIEQETAVHSGQVREPAGQFEKPLAISVRKLLKPLEVFLPPDRSSTFGKRRLDEAARDVLKYHPERRFGARFVNSVLGAEGAARLEKRFCENIRYEHKSATVTRVANFANYSFQKTLRNVPYQILANQNLGARVSDGSLGKPVAKSSVSLAQP